VKTSHYTSTLTMAEQPTNCCKFLLAETLQVRLSFDFRFEIYLEY